MDDYIGSSLYEKIPGLEEKQLNVRIQHDKARGVDTSALEKRLEEVQAQA